MSETPKNSKYNHPHFTDDEFESVSAFVEASREAEDKKKRNLRIRQGAAAVAGVAAVIGVGASLSAEQDSGLQSATTSVETYEAPETTEAAEPTKLKHINATDMYMENPAAFNGLEDARQYADEQNARIDQINVENGFSVNEVPASVVEGTQANTVTLPVSPEK